MWSVVNSYIWKHNKILVLHSRCFAPGVFLGSVADSMSLISIVPSEFLPSFQLGPVCLGHIKDTYSLEFYQFTRKSFHFLFLTPRLSHFEQIPELSFVPQWGRFRKIKEVNVLEVYIQSVSSALCDLRGHYDPLFLIAEVFLEQLTALKARFHFPGGNFKSQSLPLFPPP